MEQFHYSFEILIVVEMDCHGAFATTRAFDFDIGA
jgi:hypothetical protein